MNCNGLIDLHCHILPGLDDGAADWEESLQMARLAIAEGISAIVATPHQLGAFDHNSAALIRSRCAELQALLVQQQIPLEVRPGADIRIEPDIPERLRNGEVLTLADLGRYVLLELPHESSFPLGKLLQRLQAQEVVPVLSHPERNLELSRKPDAVRRLVEAGVVIQVTAGSFLGAFGPIAQAAAEQFLARGLIHVVATDAHGARRRRPLIRRAFEHLVSRVGWDVAMLLCRDNPQAIIRGEAVASPSELEESSQFFFGFLRWKRLAG